MCCCDERIYIARAIYYHPYSEYNHEYKFSSIQKRNDFILSCEENIHPDKWELDVKIIKGDKK